MEDEKNLEVTGDPQPRVSRRKFIQRVIATGAAASAATFVFRGAETILSQAMSPVSSRSADRLITMSVNGPLRRVDVMRQETLAMTLRYKLGLTGTN
jgi:hypothetical protein